MAQIEIIENTALIDNHGDPKAKVFEGLPMPHKSNARRSSAAEKTEYARRRQNHYDRYPDYPARFNRPPPGSSTELGRLYVGGCRRSSKS
jgi:hypothetical protein